MLADAALDDLEMAVTSAGGRPCSPWSEYVRVGLSRSMQIAVLGAVPVSPAAAVPGRNADLSQMSVTGWCRAGMRGRNLLANRRSRPSVTEAGQVQRSGSYLNDSWSLVR